MRALRLAGATILAVLWLGAAGCSNVKEEMQPAKLQPIEPSVSVERHWRVDVGKGQGVRYARLKPAQADGVIFTVDTSGRVTAVTDDGRERWRTDLETDIGGGVGVGPGLVLLG